MTITPPVLTPAPNAGLSSAAPAPAAQAVAPASADVHLFRDALRAELAPHHRASLPGARAAAAQESRASPFMAQAMELLGRPARQRVELQASLDSTTARYSELTPVGMHRAARQLAEYTASTMLATKTISQTTQTIKQLLSAQ